MTRRLCVGGMGEEGKEGREGSKTTEGPRNGVRRHAMLAALTPAHPPPRLSV